VQQKIYLIWDQKKKIKVTLCFNSFFFIFCSERIKKKFFGSEQVVLSNKNINQLLESIVPCRLFIPFKDKNCQIIFLKMINERNLTLDHPSDNSLPEAKVSFEIRKNNASSSDVTESMVYHKKESDKW
jgi:hypothetical protein